MTDKTLLTTKEAAAFLGRKPRALGAHWFRWGLKPYRVGRANMYRVSDLERFLRDNRISEPTDPRRVS